MGGSWCNKTLDFNPRNEGCKNYAPNDEVKARWKRKNREAQLKRTISKLTAWAWGWKREYEKLKADVLKTEKDVQRILDGAEPYLDAVEHTACHDIEGS